MSQRQLKKGILIALEGIDGSGKTTLAHNLYTALKEKNFDVILTREPGATEIGKKIRELIQHQEIPLCPQTQYLLFAADRAQHFTDIIIPSLNNKKIIISDRMADSSLAYQCYGNNLNKQMVDAINKWVMNNITPDLTIFVKIPVSIALERAKSRGALSAYEKQETFLHTVADGFEDLYKNRNNVIVIDGKKTQEQLKNTALHEIEQWISLQ